jgi:DNA-binding transcriptional MocR family regulator
MADGNDQRGDGRGHEFQPTAVEPRSAADQIARQLRDALTTGTLRPGDRLAPEPDMAADFGVSRATLREAIKILRAQGVLQTQRGFVAVDRLRGWALRRLPGGWVPGTWGTIRGR